MPSLTRRAWMIGAGATAIAAAAYETANTTPRPGAGARPARLQFPEGFLWGTATSAYQVEGAAETDGRGLSIWEAFAHQPGRIRDGSTGAAGVDHFHRYKEDVALMKALGVRAYRFSIAWPRVFPDGAGAVNPKGLDFYDRLVDTLLASGIEPYATLYHWDLPQALQARGGWESRDTAEAFGAYAAHVVRRLGDRVRRFFPLNEIRAFIEEGYASGIFAPGLSLPEARLNQARHHAVLAHGLGVQAVRANGRAGTTVGPAENIATALPSVETDDNIRAAGIATRELNAPYLTVMLEGRYTDAWLAGQGADAPRIAAGDLAIISSKVDFVGLNVYTPSQYVLASEAAPGFIALPLQASHPHMASPWLKLGPEALYWAPRHVQHLWGVKDIFITENGTSGADEPAEDGTVYDLDRVMYLRNCLVHLQRATAEGVPVRGYFLWSLLDNFEWADGYARRFGLVHVDFTTLKRTPKLSAAFYRAVIARNAPA
ncbi:MAG: GH1 family beta-glucosidase [Geminicoccaceae bacterium]|uniref:GH1 family beta-glucosidase n=1 Tax=Reyranella sp. TaxID=1929291 RepID=UPI003D0CE99A